MLLEFTVENYRSFYKKKTLTLVADTAQNQCLSNIFENNKYKLLKTLALYGANSSGKSNLISALYTMKYCIFSSIKLNDNEDLPFDPFLLLKNNDRPTMFEIIFLHDNYCYRYGFRYNLHRILDEWLFRKTTPRSKEQILFVRTEEGIDVNENNFPEGIGNEEKTNDNRLFLSLCQQLGGNISKQVVAWFQSKFNTISGLNNQEYRNFSKTFLHTQKESADEASRFFRKLQLGFNTLTTKIKKIDDKYQNLPSDLKTILSIDIKSTHNLYDFKGEIVGNLEFNIEERESSGTNKLIDISGPVFDTLLRGAVLIIDELDTKMHPLISQYIIELFNNAEANPNNAQLVFTTHDTHLLSQKVLRRDQIWFTEKDDYESTDLYSLMDIVLPDGTKPRNDANYEKNYIAGRYGAIPYIINE